MPKNMESFTPQPGPSNYHTARFAVATIMHEPRICLRIASLSRLYPDESVFHLRQVVVKIPTEAGGNRVPAAAKTIGMTEVACFAAMMNAAPSVTMTSTLSRTSSAVILGGALSAALRRAILDRDSATLDPTQFTHSRHKSSRPWTKGCRPSMQVQFKHGLMYRRSQR
jgi:hypothetical protein